MKSLIRNIFTQSIFFYKIWFYLNKKKLSKNIKLPSKLDDYYFDGYPRSGNTFIKGFISFISPHLRAASHLHTVAALKIALSLGLPIIIVIREPFDAIISNLYRKINNNGYKLDKLIDEPINDYVKYYQFVTLNKDKIHLVHFSDFFKDSTYQTLIILKLLKIKGIDINTIKSKFNDFELLMKSKESKKRIEISSLPNQERKDFKYKIRNKILSNSNYIVAEEVYNTLIKF